MIKTSRTTLPPTKLLSVILVGSFLCDGIADILAHRYFNCWRAVARQLSILYNSEIWPKSVGCKIVDLRSRIPSLYPGACGFGGMRSRFLYIPDMHMNAHGNIDRNSSSSRNQGHVKRSDVCCLWKDPSRSGTA